MNTVRIVKNDAAPIFFDNDGSVLDKDYGYCYKLQDTIEAKTNWTAEELVVLAGLDLDTIGYRYCDERMEQLTEHCENLSLSAYLRSHIQAEIKRQEASE